MGRWVSESPERWSRIDLSVEGIERIAEAWGPWAPVASIALMILHSFVPFPAELIAIANGMLFGPVWGTLVTWIGAMLGAALAFAFARRYGRPLIDRVAARKAWTGADALHACCDARTLLIARLVPVISFNLINYAAGVLDVGWWRFLWTTSLGILPITVASVAFGNQLTVRCGTRGSPAAGSCSPSTSAGAGIALGAVEIRLRA